jgi:predicted nucleic acid-binding Zn ribbon protein
VRTLAEAHQAHQEAVRHVQHSLATGMPAARGSAPACVRCGAPASSRPGTRFCSSRCRQAAVRERRAAARGDLLVALTQLAEVTVRVESALRILGLNPTKPRTRRAR